MYPGRHPTAAVGRMTLKGATESVVYEAVELGQSL